MAITVLAPNGKRAAPYRLEGRTLIKRVNDRHIFKLRQAVGIDEELWRELKDRVDSLIFLFPDGSAREIDAKKFERVSFLHGGDGRFALTRFVRINCLMIIQGGMRHLFEFEKGVS